MKIINYVSDEITNIEEMRTRREEIYNQQEKIMKYKIEGKEIDFDILQPLEPEHTLVKKKYKINEDEFEYWLDVIKKTYGKYGKITFDTVEDEKTPQQVTGETLNNILVENSKKDLLIEQLSKQVNTLNIEISKMKGGNIIE